MLKSQWFLFLLSNTVLSLGGLFVTELVAKSLIVRSAAFEDNQTIPAKHTCDGENVNPQLTIMGIPDSAASLALIVDDPDSPRGAFAHWVVWNISTGGEIDEHSVPGDEGLNSLGENMYSGPCPASGTHKYFFKVYALDSKLKLSPDTTKQGLEAAMQGHVIAWGALVGRYRKK
jgi:Raf kinase inhibitor-like YbhB/YbcL family protein